MSPELRRATLRIAGVNGLLTCGTIMVDFSLALFLTARSGLGWSTGAMAGTVALYLMASMLVPLAGGAFTDYRLGARRAVIAGGVIAGAGLVSLAALAAGVGGARWQTALLAAGLATVAAGYGLFRPGVIALAGALSRKDPADAEAAQTNVWVGQNVGVALGGVSSGLLSARYGWAACFTFSAAMLLAGSALGVVLLRGAEAGSASERAAAGAEEPPANWFGQIVAFGATFMLYIAIFNQVYITLGPFIDAQRLSLFGLALPAQLVLAAEPAAIIVLSPLVRYVATRRSVGGAAPTAWQRSAVGFAIIAAAYAVLSVAPASGIHAPLIVGGLVLVALSEFFQVPVGLGLLAQLAPPRWLSVAIGCWYLLQAAANVLAGWIGGLAVVLSYPALFLLIAGAGATVAAALFAHHAARGWRQPLRHSRS